MKIYEMQKETMQIRTDELNCCRFDEPFEIEKNEIPTKLLSDKEIIEKYYNDEIDDVYFANKNLKEIHVIMYSVYDTENDEIDVLGYELD